MLLPNLAYSATFSCESSSRRSPRDSSSWDTSSSMRSVEVTRRDCASESGREIKESPILYLVLFCYFKFWTFGLLNYVVFHLFFSLPLFGMGGGGSQEGENDKENLTAQIRPHLRARAPLRFLRDPLCLSGGQVSLQSFHRKDQRIFEKQWHRWEGSDSHLLCLQLLFQQCLALMQSTEAVDLILVFAAHFRLFCGSGGLFLSREL